VKIDGGHRALRSLGPRWQHEVGLILLVVGLGLVAVAVRMMLWP
jgi:hypothetical protein